MLTINSRSKQLLTLALCCVLFVSVFMLASTNVAFCATTAKTTTSGVATGIENAFSQITEQIYNIMKAVIVPCCIVALAFAGFQFLMGGNQGAEKARKVVIGCACAIGFVVFAPMVVKAVAGIIKAGNDDSGWDDYNPL